MGTFLTRMQIARESRHWIGYASSFESNCNACKKEVKTLEIIIFSKSKLFHLQCFPYVQNSVLKISDFDIHLNNNDMQLLENYLFIWNSSQLPIKRSPESYYDIKTQFNPGYFRLKRTWIEVFKFLHPIDGVLKMGTISKAIYDATKSDELWYHFYLAEYGSTKPIKKSWIEKYKITWKRTC